MDLKYVLCLPIDRVRVVVGMAAFTLLTACPPILGLSDEEACPSLRVKPSGQLASGLYELDSTSSNYLTSIGLSNPAPTSLYLDSLGFLTYSGFPLAVDSISDFDTLVNGVGTWYYHLSQNTWNNVVVSLSGLGSMTGHLCSKEGNTSIFFSVGDPDSGKGALYHKAQEATNQALVKIKRIAEERDDELTHEAEKEVPTIESIGDSVHVRYLLILNCCGYYTGSVLSERDSLFLHVLDTSSLACTCNSIYEVSFAVPTDVFKRARGLGWRKHSLEPFGWNNAPHAHR